MKSRPKLLAVSLLVNAAMLLGLAVGYGYYRFQRMHLESEAQDWALYAGTMQAIADHRGGVRRLYQLTRSGAAGDRNAFTGDREAGVEVWSWNYFPGVGQWSQAANESFVGGYNRRMRNFLAAATSGPSTSPTAAD